jgi:hypothetical protein
MAQNEIQYYAFVNMVAKICFIKGERTMTIWNYYQLFISEFQKPNQKKITLLSSPLESVYVMIAYKILAADFVSLEPQ